MLTEEKRTSGRPSFNMHKVTRCRMWTQWVLYTTISSWRILSPEEGSTWWIDRIRDYGR